MDEKHNTVKKHSKPIRGRRARKGRKRPSASSNSLTSSNQAQTFKPSFNQRKVSKKFQPLNRNPRQQTSSRTDSNPLKIITSNQIVQVSQKKDRKYHFE